MRIRVNDRYGARQFLYSDRAGGRPMIGSGLERMCDVDQGAGPRAAKQGCGQRRNGLAIRLKLNALACLERPIAAAAVQF